MSLKYLHSYEKAKLTDAITKYGAYNFPVVDSLAKADGADDGVVAGLAIAYG